MSTEATLVGTQPSWLSYHIFYHGDQDLLLMGCIRPMILRLRTSNLVNDYFFIRYWNGGPHVRLRVRAERKPSEVREMVLTGVRDFLTKSPAGGAITSEQYASYAKLRHQRNGSAFDGENEEVEPLRSPDTIEERSYVYESRRYGAWAGAQEATERHFRFSSDLAMFILDQTRDRIDTRLTTALILTVVAARELGMDNERSARVLTSASRLLDHVTRDLGSQPVDTFTARGFPNLRELSEEVGPTILQVVDDQQGGSEHPSLRRVSSMWRDDLRRTFTGIIETAPSSIDPTKARLRAIDYIHMLNNRLGIPIDQECFTYALVADLFEKKSALTRSALANDIVTSL